MWKRKLAKIEKGHFAVAVGIEGRKYKNQCKDKLTKRIHVDNMTLRVDFNS